MATVWTVPEDITRVLLAAPGIRDFITDDEGRGVVSDPKVRLAEFTAVVNALHLNAGRTFTSVRDAAGVLFDAPATGGVVVSDALRLAVMRVITAEPRERKPAPNPLSPRVVENLGLYVYALRDPRDLTIFYVGVGRGNKVYSHDWDALGEAGTLDAEGVGEADRTRPAAPGSSGSVTSTPPGTRSSTSCSATGSMPPTTLPQLPRKPRTWWSTRCACWNTAPITPY
ncbi:GIY-YIG nuclease family protein [Prescottella defluvii]|nr:GIY-YIG nuclease family protein [Prescottella defluvii]